jgi:hypothetical protein
MAPSKQSSGMDIDSDSDISIELEQTAKGKGKAKGKGIDKRKRDKGKAKAKDTVGLNLYTRFRNVKYTSSQHTLGRPPSLVLGIQCKKMKREVYKHQLKI